MKIFDENGNVITNPDLEAGALSVEEMSVIHKWVVDVEKQSHIEVIAEYPSGGKDIKEVVDVEEVGHWETRDENGELVEEFDGFIPDDAPKELIIKNVWQFMRYTLYTEEELEEIEKQKEEAAAAAAAAAEREQFLEGAPARVNGLEGQMAALTSAFGGVE